MKSNYSNTDFYLSSFLITKGCPLKGHSKSNQQTIFEFEDNLELRELVQQFYSYSSTVEPMAFSANIRNLKSVIHNSANSNSKGNHNVTGSR